MTRLLVSLTSNKINIFIFYSLKKINFLVKKFEKIKKPNNNIIKSKY